jgi:hypothetical protein
MLHESESNGVSPGIGGVEERFMPDRKTAGPAYRLRERS